MEKRTFVKVLLLSLIATFLGCATVKTVEHKYLMRGSVLEVTDGTVYLCLGTEQGANVGQEFTVVRYVREPGGKGTVSYKVEKVGTVKITDVESHMANAKIITGDVKANDVVQLNP